MPLSSSIESLVCKVQERASANLLGGESVDKAAFRYFFVHIHNTCPTPITLPLLCMHAWGNNNDDIIVPVGITFSFVSALAETNRVPFDLTEGESGLVSGFNVKYSSLTDTYFTLMPIAS